MHCFELFEVGFVRGDEMRVGQDLIAAACSTCVAPAGLRVCSCCVYSTVGGVHMIA